MRCAQIAGGTLLAAALLAMPAVAAPTPSDARGWLGEELPLPLAVRTPQDLAVKSAAEKQYLIFNLLAGGKLAWDAGDFATEATKWEALLRIHTLDPELEKTIKPLVNEASPRRPRGGDPQQACGELRARPRRGRPPRRGPPASVSDAAFIHRRRAAA